MRPDRDVEHRLRFKRLRGARLDGTYEDEMRKLHRVELLIIDDLALHRLEVTDTTDFYEIIVERHRWVCRWLRRGALPVDG